MKIGFLGAGHLGKSLINGLLVSGQYHKEDFKIVVASDSSVQFFQRENFHVSKDWKILSNCDVIILTLRPNDIKELKNKLSATFSNKQIIISVAAGVSLAKLQEMFPNCLISRVMPNTSSQFNQSMTMISKEGHQEANSKAEQIFSLLGKTVIFPEKKMHVFIAICGSASAYLYYWLEPLVQLALDRDISLEDSKVIIAQLLIGVAANISFSKESLAELQKQVTVPGGTTFEAIKIFDQDKVKDSISAAINAVANRSQELES